MVEALLVTKEDYKFLEALALYHYYKKDLLESVISRPYVNNKILEQFLLEATSEPTKEEADELWDEFKEDEKKLQESGDDVWSGIGRLFAVYEKTMNIYQKIAGSVVLAWPLKWIFGKTYEWMKVKGELQNVLDTNSLLDRSRKILTKSLKREPTNEEIAAYAKKLRMIQLTKLKRKNYADWAKKAKATNSLWAKFRAKLAKIWMKSHPQRLVYYLSEHIEKLIKLTQKHPYLAVLTLALIIGLIILTIFKWNTVKRFLKLIVRIITAPFRIMWKGLKWLFSKLMFWKKKEKS